MIGMAYIPVTCDICNGKGTVTDLEDGELVDAPCAAGCQAG